MSDTTRMGERRRAVRVETDSLVKVQCMSTGRYLGGKAQNMSRTGALLRVDHPSLLVAGQRIRIGIAQHPRQVLLMNRDLVEATVVRSLGLGRMQTVAVEFDQPQAAAASA